MVRRGAERRVVQIDRVAGYGTNRASDRVGGDRLLWPKGSTYAKRPNWLPKCGRSGGLCNSSKGS
jgi:hypothetical protein